MTVNGMLHACVPQLHACTRTVWCHAWCFVCYTYVSCMRSVCDTLGPFELCDLYCTCHFHVHQYNYANANSNLFIEIARIVVSNCNKQNKRIIRAQYFSVYVCIIFYVCVPRWWMACYICVCPTVTRVYMHSLMPYVLCLLACGVSVTCVDHLSCGWFVLYLSFSNACCHVHQYIQMPIAICL